MNFEQWWYDYRIKNGIREGTSRIRLEYVEAAFEAGKSPSPEVTSLPTVRSLRCHDACQLAVGVVADVISGDTDRIEWLAKELPVTIAYALKWTANPQDARTFRAQIDASMRLKPQSGRIE